MLCPQKELTSLAQPLLDSLPQAAKEGSPKSEYVGGDFRLATPQTPLSNEMHTSIHLPILAA